MSPAPAPAPAAAARSSRSASCWAPASCRSCASTRRIPTSPVALAPYQASRSAICRSPAFSRGPHQPRQRVPPLRVGVDCVTGKALSFLPVTSFLPQHRQPHYVVGPVPEPAEQAVRLLADRQLGSSSKPGPIWTRGPSTSATWKASRSASSRSPAFSLIVASPCSASVSPASAARVYKRSASTKSSARSRASARNRRYVGSPAVSATSWAACTAFFQSPARPHIHTTDASSSKCPASMAAR